MKKIKKQERLRWIVYILITVLLIGSTLVALRRHINQQFDYSELIEKVGQQRALCQSIAILSNEISKDSILSQNAMVNLNTLLKNIQSSQDGLSNYYSTIGNHKKLDSLIVVSNNSLKAQNLVVQKILDSKATNSQPIIYQTDLESELPYLLDLEEITKEFKLLSQQNIKKLKLDFLILCLVAVLSFIFGVFYLYKPTTKKLTKKYEELVESNQQLKASKEDVKSNLKELKKLKKDLEEQERYLRIFVDQAPPSLAMLDKDMRYIAVSQKWREDYNLIDADIIGKSHYDVFPEIGDNWKQKHKECLNGKIDKCDEAVFVRRDGTKQFIFWDVRPWYINDNEIGGLLMHTGDITDSVAMRTSKERTDEILAKATEMARIGTWELDLVTNKYSFNDFAYELLGLSRDKTYYREDSYRVFKDGPSKEKIAKAAMLLIETGEPFDLELEMVTAQNEPIWVRDIGLPEYEKGKVVRIFGMFQDISETKNFQKELERRNQQLEQAEEMTLMGNWQWDMVKDKIKWSKGLYNIFDLSEDEVDLTFGTYFSFVHPDDQERVNENLQSTIENKQFPKNFIHKIITSKGEVKSVLLIGDVITNEKDEVVELYGTLQDVTEQRLEELKFRGLLESAPDAMIITDQFGIVQIINKEAEHLFGYKPDEVIGKDAIIFIPERIQGKFKQRREKYFNDPSHIPIGENTQLLGQKKSGTEFPIQISLNPLKTENEILVSIAIRDISKQKQAKRRLIDTNRNLQLLAEKLQKQNTQLADFAQITSHNLRAPVSNLNSLLYVYDSVESEAEKNEVFEQFNEVIDHLTDTLNTLIESLKIKEDKSKRQHVYFDETLQQVKMILGSQIKESKAIITEDFSQVNKIHYNKLYFESIILNLVDNAIKYRSPERTPKIHLKTEMDNNRFILRVSDNGLGINLNRHGSKIFGLNKVFHRHPDSRGVGLYMIKLQVEAMGGKIFVESEEKVGSTFSIIFNLK